MERAFDEQLADRIRDFTRDLGDIVRQARQREQELSDTISKLKGENARLTAKLQGVRDQVADVSDDLPTVDAIAGRGSAHKAVNKDIRELAESLETGIASAQPVKQTKGLAMLLGKLRAEQTREPMEEFPEPRRVEA